MSESGFWQLATLCAAVVAGLAIIGKGNPNAGLRTLGLPALPLPDYAKADPFDTTPTDYGEPRSYVQDQSGGALPGCNGCGPGASIRFFGTPDAVAAFVASTR